MTNLTKGLIIFVMGTVAALVVAIAIETAMSQGQLPTSR